MKLRNSAFDSVSPAQGGQEQIKAENRGIVKRLKYENAKEKYGEKKYENAGVSNKVMICKHNTLEWFSRFENIYFVFYFSGSNFLAYFQF